jgi:hypothetical protein
MHAPARRALWQFSRRKARSPIPIPRLQHRTFHITLSKQENSKPPSDTNDPRAVEHGEAHNETLGGGTENGKPNSKERAEAVEPEETRLERETQANIEHSNQTLDRIEVARLKTLKDGIKGDTLELEKLVRARGSPAQEDNVQQLLERIDKKAELFAQTLDGIPLPGAKRRGRRRTPIGRARYRTPDALVNPKLELPDWVIERNVTFFEDGITKSGTEAQTQKLAATVSSNLGATTHGEALIELNAERRPEPGYTGDMKFLIHSEVYLEIYASIAASFTLARGSSKPDLAFQKTNLALTCGLDGGAAMLESIVGSIATSLEADILRLNAQDLAEIAFHNLQLFESSPEVQEVAELGFEIHSGATSQESMDNQDKDDDEEMEVWSKGRRIGTRRRVRAILESTQQPLAISESSNALQDFLSGLINGIYTQKRVVDPVTATLPQSKDIFSTKETSDPSTSNLATKPTKTLEESESIGPKLAPSSVEGNKNSTPTVVRRLKNRKLIIFLEDFLDIASSSTHIGETLIQTLAALVHWQRTFFNEQIMIVATKSSSDSLAESSDLRAGLDQAAEGSVFRHILVTPVDETSSPSITGKPDLADLALPPAANVWARLSSNQTLSINIRNLEHMLKYFSPSTSSKTFSKGQITLPDHIIHRFDLRDQVLSKEQVSRIATVTLGLHEIGKHNFAVRDYLPRAMEIIHKCDAQLQGSNATGEAVPVPLLPNPKANKQRMETLKSRCNKYERQLLSGVLHPKNIKIGFGDVHVAVDTVEALKTVTSLSLTRPEAFQYGILKSDSLPGLLMYG